MQTLGKFIPVIITLLLCASLLSTASVAAPEVECTPHPSPLCPPPPPPPTITLEPESGFGNPFVKITGSGFEHGKVTVFVIDQDTGAKVRVMILCANRQGEFSKYFAFPTDIEGVYTVKAVQCVCGERRVAEATFTVTPSPWDPTEIWAAITNLENEVSNLWAEISSLWDAVNTKTNTRVYGMDVDESITATSTIPPDTLIAQMDITTTAPTADLVVTYSSSVEWQNYDPNDWYIVWFVVDGDKKTDDLVFSTGIEPISANSYTQYVLNVGPGVHTIEVHGYVYGAGNVATTSGNLAVTVSEHS